MSTAGAQIEASLARRIERAEELACASSAQTAAAADPTSQVEVREIGGGTAVFAGVGNPMSQAIGCGVTVPIGAEDIDAIEEFYWSRGARSQIVVATEHAPALLEQLQARGYVMDERNLALVSSSSTSASSVAPIGYSIVPVPPENAMRWAEMEADIFFQGAPEGRALVPMFASMATTAKARAYVAVEESSGDFVAGAMVWIFADERLACLAGSATRAKHRGRGLQTAMIKRRVGDAVAANCDLIFVSTLRDTPSYRNAVRAGFQVAYERWVMVKEPQVKADAQ